MGGQGKPGKAIPGYLVLMHIALHQERGLGGGSHALYGLEVRVTGGGECRVHVGTDRIRKFFHAHHERHIHHAAGNGKISLAQRGAPRCPCSFNGHCLDAKHSRIICQKHAEVGLVRKIGRQHIAYKKRLGCQPACILDRITNGRIGQVSQTDIPVLTDFCLSNSCDYNVCHCLFPDY